MSFWPHTLMDWFQIASALGTCGAVVMSLILANRGIQTKIGQCVVVVRDCGEPRLRIDFRNVGRDTVFLSVLGGTDSTGVEKRYGLPTFDKPMQLPPGAPEKITLEKHRTITEPVGGLHKQFIRLWLEDSSGKRFYVKNSFECLDEIWAEMRE